MWTNIKAIRRRWSCLLISIGFCFSSILSAKDAPIRFGVIDIGYPVGYLDKNQRPSGIYTEITRAIVDKLAEPATLDIVPYTRLLRLLDMNAIDCAIFFTSTERKQKYQQIGLVVKRPIIIVGSEQFSTKGVDQLSHFYGKTIGAIRHPSRDDPVHLDPNIIKYWVDDYAKGIEMLKLNRIDAFMGAKDVIDEFYDTQGEFYVHRVDESWLQCSASFGSEQASIRTDLQMALASLHNDDIDGDTIYAIHKKYFRNYQLFARAKPLEKGKVISLEPH